jgi:2-methylcitrate dehydratase PrpD
VGHPFQIRDNPQVDAQFSIPYTVAVALQRGKVTLSDFEVETVKQPRTGEFAKKVTVEENKTMDKYSTVVHIHNHSGKSFAKRVDVFKGHPQNPLTREEFLQKFRDCARYSAVPLDAQRVEKMLARLQEIENIPNLSQAGELLA